MSPGLHDAATVVLADLSLLLVAVALTRHVSAAATVWLPVRLPIRLPIGSATIWLSVGLTIWCGTTTGSILLLTVSRSTKAGPAPHSIAGIAGRGNQAADKSAARGTAESRALKLRRERTA